MENQAEVLKIQEFLKSRFPQLNNQEIEKNSKQLVELGFFLVRLKIKNHSNTSKTSKAVGFREETEDPT